MNLLRLVAAALTAILVQIPVWLFLPTEEAALFTIFFAFITFVVCAMLFIIHVGRMDQRLKKGRK